MARVNFNGLSKHPSPRKIFVMLDATTAPLKLKNCKLFSGMGPHQTSPLLIRDENKPDATPSARRQH
jgi:hypothetical protein